MARFGGDFGNNEEHVNEERVKKQINIYFEAD